MRKIIIRDNRFITPFNETARDLRVLNKPLWLQQRDTLTRYCTSEVELEQVTVNDILETSGELPEKLLVEANGNLELKSIADIPQASAEVLAYKVYEDKREKFKSAQPILETSEELIIYRDNLFFDEHLLAEFITKAHSRGRASRICFDENDLAITRHALPLQSGIRKQGSVYVADMWYFPSGYTQDIHNCIVDTQPREMGYYNIPSYMASEQGELVFHVPMRAFLSIENWVHIYMANCVFGIFAIGGRYERDTYEKPLVGIKSFLRSLLERKHLLSNSEVVHIGKNCHMDPTTNIQGPTFIGNNVNITGPGVTICNCMIGDNVTIGQGTMLFLSVVGNDCMLPFNTALYMTTLMENAMVAQNTCLQLCVVGRNSFVGAGTTFTDLNLVPRPVMTMHNGQLQEVGFPVMGGCVGHNCRIGSGLVFYPARTIESDSVVARYEGRSVVTRNLAYEESDHHRDRQKLFRRRYPPQHK